MKLYPYQQRVKELIQSGKSVILQAPTGAGKTRAALAPFIENFFDHADGTTPRKCVYSVPMRVLANQFEADYRDLANTYQRINREEFKVTIQTGERSEDREFTGDLIFCTIDQFLSSYLTIPYSLPRRLANLNAGAFVGSYLVFDEFHLLDPDSTLPSTLYALKQLSRVAPVLLMTATFSKSVLYALKDQLHNAEVVLVNPAEARSIETAFGSKEMRKRVWNVVSEPLSAKAVLEKHNKRSLVICNTVRRAQELYRELKDEAKDENIELILLHSRFLLEDRQKNEQDIKLMFGRGNSDGSVIAVTTQVVEVGVDITSEILHTELAPASALIQRAGRCARYAGEYGQVIVYPVERKSPYRSKSWENEMDEAFRWLTEHNNQVLDFGTEQEFVDAVATARDEQILTKLSAGRMIRSESIKRVLLGDVEGTVTRELVRDADSKLVLIHPNPKDELTFNPYLAKGFNISSQTLYGMVKEWLKSDADWCVKMLIEDTIDKQEDNRTDYDWRNLTDEKLLSSTRVIVVNPELAGYLEDEGFVSDKGNTDFVSTMPEVDGLQKRRDGYSYKKESYEEHIRRVLRAFQDISLNGLLYSAPALEVAAGWSDGSVMRAVWLACLFHDVGKLSKGWQGWARAYQRQIGMPVAADFAAGHTENEWHNQYHKDAEKVVSKRYPKPNHAGEGVLATSKLIANTFMQNEKDLAKAVLTAITRHHTSFASGCGAFVLEDQAEAHIYATLEYVPSDVCEWAKLEMLRTESKSIQNDLSNLLITPDKDYGWMAYTLIVRALRRSDQEGTARGTREEM